MGSGVRPLMGCGYLLHSSHLGLLCLHLGFVRKWEYSPVSLRFVNMDSWTDRCLPSTLLTRVHRHVGKRNLATSYITRLFIFYFTRHQEVSGLVLGLMTPLFCSVNLCISFLNGIQQAEAPLWPTCLCVPQHHFKLVAVDTREKSCVLIELPFPNLR